MWYRCAGRGRKVNNTCRRVIRLDRERLAELAGVEKFSDSCWRDLIELTTTLAERWRGPMAPDFMLDAAWTGGLHRQPRQIEIEVRRAFVEAVEQIWHESGGTGWGSSYVKDKGYIGPLNRLLQELLRATGDNKPGAAGENKSLAAALHHDIEFLRTGTERDHGKLRPSR